MTLTSSKKGRISVRIRFTFKGYVQGVGFRWRASNAARLYGVYGYVKNNYDGSVELEAEGKREAINSMIRSIQDGRYIQIDSVDSKEMPECGYSSFEVL